MSPVRPPAPPQTVAAVTFGDLSFYTGGGGLPEGDYCLYFELRMHQAINKQTNQARGAARLGVMITAYDLHDPTADPREQFYSMGRKAHLSFQPDPNTGKSLVAAANPAGSTLNNKTNWFIFLKSLYDCGMPEGTLQNDLTAIDGVHVHVSPVPAPEDRKGFGGGAKTGDFEEGEEEIKGSDTISVVGQILETGKPWEGTGGVPAAAAAPAPKVAPKAPPAPVGLPKPGPRAVPAARPAVAAPAPVPVAAAVDGDELMQVALQALGEVLVKPNLKNGGLKLTLRTETFKWVKENADEATANAVINGHFGSDDALNGLLNQVGYSVSGTKFAPQ